jgi:hypothetical protein
VGYINTVPMQRVGQDFNYALEPSQALGLSLGGNDVSEYDGTVAHLSKEDLVVLRRHRSTSVLIRLKFCRV